jgi:hypothetical protein
VPLKPEVLDDYNKFATFYNAFLVNWDKAITTAVSLQTDQEPQATPDEETPSSPPPLPTLLQKNKYILDLSSTLHKPLPLLTDPLPTELTSTALPQVLQSIPQEDAPYQNAMDWMNEQMQQSQQNLGQALQGQLPNIEGFEDTVNGAQGAPVCQEVSQCVANNPEFIAQVAQQVSKEQESQKKQSTDTMQQELLQRILPFLQNSQLLQTGQANQALAAQADKTQQQAQSGELYQQLDLPKEPEMPTILPSGAFSLRQMQQENPQQYNQLQDNYKQWFDMKQLIEQINKSL